MTLRSSFCAPLVLAVLACGFILEERVAAQYARRAIDPLPDGWENNRFRVLMIMPR